MKPARHLPHLPPSPGADDRAAGAREEPAELARRQRPPSAREPTGQIRPPAVWRRGRHLNTLGSPGRASGCSPVKRPGEVRIKVQGDSPQLRTEPRSSGSLIRWPWRHIPIRPDGTIRPFRTFQLALQLLYLLLQLASPDQVLLQLPAQPGVLVLLRLKFALAGCERSRGAEPRRRGRPRPALGRLA
jgi:hypothetical protein